MEEHPIFMARTTIENGEVNYELYYKFPKGCRLDELTTLLMCLEIIKDQLMTYIYEIENHESKNR